MMEHRRHRCGRRRVHVGSEAVGYRRAVRSGVRRSGAAASERQGLEAAQDNAVAEPGPVFEQLDLREALQQRLEDDPALKPRERGAQAIMDAPAQGQVGTLGTADVEAVGMVEGLRVAIGGADQEDDVVLPAQFEPVHLAVREGAAEERLGRRIVAQQFFHRGGDQARILAQPPELVRVAQQREHPVADQVGGGLVAGDQEQAQHVERLALGQPLALVLHLHQRAQDVVAGLDPALRDNRPEIRVELAGGVHGDGALAGTDRGLQQPGALIRPEPEPVPVLRRYAQHLRDHDDRQGLGERGHEIEARCGVDLVEERGRRLCGCALPGR